MTTSNESTPRVVEGYLKECETIAAHGLTVLDPAQAAKFAAITGGEVLLDMIRRQVWDLESANRDVKKAAASVARYATDVTEQVENYLQISGSLGGETWVTSSARDLQKAVDARTHAIKQIQQFTYAARQMLGL